MNKIEINKLIKDWLTGAEKDFSVAKSLFKLNYYPQCLFFCHLSLEKLLKAAVIKKIKDYPPFIHDLRRLAEVAGLDLFLSTEQKIILDKISTFNIAGRYIESKTEFYKKYNKKEDIRKYLTISTDLFIWLKKEFQKK